MMFKETLDYAYIEDQLSESSYFKTAFGRTLVRFKAEMLVHMALVGLLLGESLPAYVANVTFFCTGKTKSACQIVAFPSLLQLF